MISEEALDQAATAIKQADQVVLACHVGPDGDALGSMLGMARLLQQAGKKTFASFGEPFVVGDAYRYLPLDLLVPPGSVPAAPELMMTFDAGSIDRLGVLAAPATNASALIVVDHHVSNTGFGHINLIDGEAAATAEVCHRLVGRLGWTVDDVTATCFHTGLVTDTGRFQYSNTSPTTLRVAADMVEAGARPEVVGQHIYEEAPFGYLAVCGAVLSRARLDPERRLVWSLLTLEDLAAAGIGLDDTDGLIDAIRVAAESDVALLVKDLGDNRVKASLRSRGRADVGAIAVELGGGGHHNASGFTFTGTPEQLVEEVTRRLDVVGPSSDS